VALQNQWSLAVPDWKPAEDPTVRHVTESDAAWCTTNEVAIHAYSSTANGYFGKDLTDGPFLGNEALRQRAQELAAKLDRTPNQIALAWLLNQPGTVIPILGTKNLAHLKDAFGALDLKLDPQTLTWLRVGRRN
jgi:aryl-alcohol dehydrogenase-like predicted oxidoreductase